MCFYCTFENFKSRNHAVVLRNKLKGDDLEAGPSNCAKMFNLFTNILCFVVLNLSQQTWESVHKSSPKF